MLALIKIIEARKINKEILAEPSSTNLSQQWDKRRGPKVKPEPVSQMLISKPGNTNRKKPVMAKYNDNRYTLISFIYVGFYYKT